MSVQSVKDFLKRIDTDQAFRGLVPFALVFPLVMPLS